MRGGSHAGDLLQQRHVLRMAAELVVADQEAEGIAAEGAVLLFVHLLEQHALVELQRLVEVLEHFGLGGAEQAQLEPRRRLGVHDHEVQSAPRRLELLKVGMMEDLVELLAEQLVDARDLGLDHGQRVAADGHALIEDLMDEFADQVFGAGLLALVARHLALVHDLVEQRAVACGGAGACSSFRCGFFSHWRLLPLP